jgi:hypothetical protein
MFWHCYMVIKYLTISQHDDSYTILDKMKHLLVDHYVKNDVQSLNVALNALRCNSKKIIFITTNLVL